MCVNNLSNAALDSAAAGFEPATSSRKSNALTTAPPLVAYVHNFIYLASNSLSLHAASIMVVVHLM